MAQQTITLGAGAQSLELLTGKFITIVSCTVPFKVEMDNDGTNAAVSGSQFSKSDGFTKLRFFETKGVDNQITFDVSDTPSPGRATVVQASAATFVGENSDQYDVGTSLPDGGLVTFPGVDAQGRERKLIYITNDDDAARIFVAYVDVVLFKVAVVYPQKTLVLETNATLVIEGVNSHQTAYVLEIFYSKPLQTDQ
jgi:hypothetical protein